MPSSPSSLSRHRQTTPPPPEKKLHLFRIRFLPPAHRGRRIAHRASRVRASQTRAQGVRVHALVQRRFRRRRRRFRRRRRDDEEEKKSETAQKKQTKEVFSGVRYLKSGVKVYHVETHHPAHQLLLPDNFWHRARFPNSVHPGKCGRRSRASRRNAFAR